MPSVLVPVMKAIDQSPGDCSSRPATSPRPMLIITFGGAKPSRFSRYALPASYACFDPTFTEPIGTTEDSTIFAGS